MDSNERIHQRSPSLTDPQISTKPQHDEQPNGNFGDDLESPNFGPNNGLVQEDTEEPALVILLKSS